MSATLIRAATFVLLVFFAASPLAAQTTARRVSLAGGYLFRYQDVGAMNGFVADIAVPAIWKFDVVGEGSWARGSLVGSDPFPVGGTPSVPYHTFESTFATAMAGLRVSGTTPVYGRLRFSAQVLGGVVATHLSGSLSIFNETSFGLQPGVAVEFPVFRRAILRPQVDGIVGTLSGIIPNGRRGSVLLVMRPGS